MRELKALTAVLMKIQVFLNIQRSAGAVTDISGEANCLRIQGTRRADVYEISVCIYRSTRRHILRYF
jgi:hypothetical protein